MLRIILLTYIFQLLNSLPWMDGPESSNHISCRFYIAYG